MNQKQLPYFAEKILKLVLPSEDLEFLLDDYNYLYNKKLGSNGFFRTRLWLWIIIIKSIPNYINFHFITGVEMIFNYIKIAFRNLSRYRLISFINILGLSVAIGISIVAFLFVDFTYNRDQFHEKVDETYLIHRTIEVKDREELWGTTPLPLGPAIAESFSSVENAVRLRSYDVKVKRNDVVFGERIFFTDETFFNVFDFNISKGNQNALSIKNSIVLSENSAKKYFGNDDPIGKELQIIYHGNEKETYIVGAVLEKYPKNSSVAFPFLLPFKNRPDYYDKGVNEWKILCDATFIQVKPGTEISQLENDIQKFIPVQNAAVINGKMKKFIMEPLSQMAADSYKVKDDIVYLNLHPGQVLSMLSLGLIIMALACFNYMNISLSNGSNRFKEIAIRKVIGGRQKNLIVQHLTENIVLAIITLILGIVSAQFLFIPLFKSFMTVFDFEIDLLNNWRLIIYLLCMIGIVGILSGIYPAFYISSFNPINIFRRKTKIKKNGFVTNTLIVFQFVFAFISLVSAVVFYLNNQYQKERDWGYDQHNKLGISVTNTEQFTTLKNILLSNPDVISSTASYHKIGRSFGQSDIYLNGEKYMTSHFPVGYDFCKTFDLSLIDGRDFDENHMGTIKNSVIVNETFLKYTNIKEPIGKTFTRNNINYTITGVVKDFHYVIFMKKIDPLIIYHTSDVNYRYLYLSVVPGSISAVEEEIKTIWKEKFSDYPLNIVYQDQAFAEYLDAMKGLAEFTSFTGFVSLLITCMGIFGVVALNISKRLKEINIRKVLGASKLDLIKLINKGFIIILVLAFIIGIPISYFAMNGLLSSIWEYHRPLDHVPYIISIIIVLVSAVLTLTSQYVKTINSNPSEALKEN